MRCAGRPEHPTEAEAEAPVAPLKRAATFFLRLSRALHEQNWLAAGIELGIVVLGVVIYAEEKTARLVLARKSRERFETPPTNAAQSHGRQLMPRNGTSSSESAAGRIGTKKRGGGSVECLAS